MSNLAWPSKDREWACGALKELGIEGVEVAPLKDFDSWEAISKCAIDELRSFYDKFDLKISSLQAITYGKQLRPLDDLDGHVSFLSHMEVVASVLANLGGDVAVFGSPGLRNFVTDEIAPYLTLFDAISKKFEVENVVLGLEAVPEYYGSLWNNNYRSMSDFVDMIDGKGVVPHFDSGCHYLSGIQSDKNVLKQFLQNSRHLHISEVDLKMFDKPSTYNLEVSELVSDYQGRWVVLEMSENSFDKNVFVRSVENFIKLFRDIN
ncbi:sugar phosphate isomerase/epimerase family protein [Microbulbifer agarilyticus]